MQKILIARPQQLSNGRLELMITTLHHLNILNLLIHQLLQFRCFGRIGLNLIDIAITKMRPITPSKYHNTTVDNSRRHSKSHEYRIARYIGLIPDVFSQIVDMNVLVDAVVAAFGFDLVVVAAAVEDYVAGFDELEGVLGAGVGGALCLYFLESSAGALKL